MISIKLFLIAMIISIIMTVAVKIIAIKIGVVDLPKGGRKIHNKSTPLLGGIAIYIAFAITSLFFTEKIEKDVIAILIAAIPILICGILDDIYELKPLTKLLFQFVAAIILIVLGVKINVLANPFGSSDILILKYLSIPITLFWVIGVTNAFNLIDGLDGLCSGIAFISSLSMYFMSIFNGRPMVAALTIILCGATLGFLFFNFNPASIFLGDTGALLLGFFLACFSIVGTIKSATAFAVAVPLLSLGLPIYDTIFAMIRRKVNGRAIMEADKGHLHHRLLALGLSQKQVVIVMYALSALLGLISIVALEVTTSNSFIILGLVMIVIIFIAFKAGFFKHK